MVILFLDCSPMAFVAAKKTIRSLEVRWTSVKLCSTDDAFVSVALFRAFLPAIL